MSDGTDTMQDELTRRLSDLAATTAADPGAWDRIYERTAAAVAAPPPRRRFGPGPGLSARGLLAVAAVVALVVGAGVAAAALRRADHHRVRTSDEPPTTASSVAPAPVRPAPTPSPTTAPPAPTSVPPTTALAPTAACQTGCVDSASGDVDGDGRPDAVALYATPAAEPDATSGFVRVVYASGAVEETAVRKGPGVLDQILGVTDLDGDGRAEVAFAYVPGAHTWWGGFAGTGGTGSLHRVGFADDVPFADLAAAAARGFACPDLDGDGRREFVIVSAAGDLATSEMSISTTTFRWQGDRLVEIDSRVESVPFDGGQALVSFAAASGGSQCPGLASPSERA